LTNEKVGQLTHSKVKIQYSAALSTKAEVAKRVALAIQSHQSLALH
jgi:hypothetical protein